MKLIATSLAALVLTTGMALADSSTSTTIQTDNSVSAPMAGGTSIKKSEKSVDANGVKREHKQSFSANASGTKKRASHTVSGPLGSHSASVSKEQSPDGSSTTTTHSSSSSVGQ